MKRSILKNAPSLSAQAGFSLVAVLGFAAMIGGLSYFVMEMQRKGSLSDKTLQGQNDAGLLSGYVTNLLADGQACLMTFGGLDPSLSGNAVPQIKDKAGSAVFALGGIYGNHTLRLSGITLGGSGIDPKSKVAKWAASSATKGAALVQLDWQQTGSGTNQALGPAHLFREFLIDATIDATTKKITACAARTSAITQAKIGSGTPGRIPLWISDTELGDSIFFQSGNNIGQGTTTPLSTLSLNGGFSVGSYSGMAPAPANSLIVSGNLGVGTPNPSSPLTLKGALRLAGSTTGYLGFRAPASTPAPLTWTLPKGNGMPGQLLMTDGHGTLSWSYCPPPPAGCAAQIRGECQLPNTPSGGKAGTCLPGDSGACSYSCNNKTWTLISDTCARPCTATTISNCELGNTPSGGTSGTCSAGFTGACQYTCTNGAWGPPNSNTCTCPSGSKSYTTPGTYTFTVPLCFNSLTVQVWGAGGGGQAAGVVPPGLPLVMGGGSGGSSSFGGILTAQGGNGVTGGSGLGGTTNLTGESGNWNGTNCSGLGGGNGKDPTTTRRGTFPGGGGDGNCFGWGANGGGGGGFSSTTFGKGSLAPGSTISIEVGAGGTYNGAGGQVLIDWN